jgi:hypothetical protein
MSKQCKSCNRNLDEYYKLRNGTIMCYNCWLREKENAQRIKADNYRQFQEEQIRHRDMERNLDNIKSEIINYEYSAEYREYMNNLESSFYGFVEEPPGYAYRQTLINKKINLEREISRFYRVRNYPDFSYLDNPTFYSREDIKIEEEREKKEREQRQREAERKQKEFEIKTIVDAKALFETVKQQKFTSEIIEDVKNKIRKIYQLLKTNTFQDSQEALSLMKNEYVWQYKNDTYKSALYNITETRHNFIKQREETKQKTFALFNTISQSITKDYNGQTTEIIKKAAARIKNGKYDDYLLANCILKMKHDWKTEKGDTFHSTLSNFDFELEKTERKAQERETKEQENRKRLQERENEEREILKRAEEKKDEVYTTYYISLVAIIIGIVVLFFTGHWFFGILGIIFFLIYALARHVSLFYEYDEYSDMKYHRQP